MSVRIRPLSRAAPAAGSASAARAASAADVLARRRGSAARQAAAAIAVLVGVAALAVRGCTRGPFTADPASAVVAATASAGLSRTASEPDASRGASRTRRRAAAPAAATVGERELEHVSPWAVDAAASELAAAERRRHGGPAEPPRRADRPSDAVLLVAARDLHAWATVARAPRGVAGEPATLAGRVDLHLSAPTDRPLAFRVSSEPDGAVLLPRGGIVRVEPGRDVASFVVGGGAAGRASLVLAPAEGADAGALPLRAELDVRPHEDFPEPLLAARAALDDGRRAADATAGGDTQLAALRGTRAGAVRVLRSGFRGFAEEPTVVQIAADDPDGILGPLPASLTIPAGAEEAAEPLVVDLRDAAGRARLRFRSGTQETSLAVRSLTARWVVAERIVVPSGAVADVPVRLTPGTESVPEAEAATEDPAVATATIAAEHRAPFAEGFRVRVAGRSAGATIVRLSAPRRPSAQVAVTVGPAEIAVRAGRPVLLRSRAGEVVLSVAPPGRFVSVPRDGSTRVDVQGEGTSTVVVRVAAPAPSSGELALPLRIDGAPARLRVEDRRGDPIPPYEVDLDDPSR